MRETYNHVASNQISSGTPSLASPSPASDHQASETSGMSRETFRAAAGSEIGIAMPWWPTDRPPPGIEWQEVWHATTRLRNGKLSMIIDPGAWTHLMGSELARELARGAMANGHTPTQKPLDGGSMSIQGVGNGHQTSNWDIRTPIAVPTPDGGADLHTLLPSLKVPAHRFPASLAYDRWKLRALSLTWASAR